MNGWRPRRADPSAPRPLQDGTPPHLEQSLRVWVFAHLTTDGYMGRVPDRAVIREWDLVSEKSPLLRVVEQSNLDQAWARLSADDRLDLTDWLLYRDSQIPTSDPRAMLALTKILADGSSLWQVGTRGDYSGLVRRVPEGVQQAAESAMATPGDAGALLSDAWGALYGRDQDAGTAYRDAIRAVEAAAVPVVSAADTTATLGKVIGKMRADGDWTVTLERAHPQNPLDQVLLDMMQALWSGHSDRHAGTADFSRTTSEAATAAVGLAVTLVNWFAAGAVVRSPAR